MGTQQPEQVVKSCPSDLPKMNKIKVSGPYLARAFGLHVHTCRASDPMEDSNWVAAFCKGNDAV